MQKFSLAQNCLRWFITVVCSCVVIGTCLNLTWRGTADHIKFEHWRAHRDLENLAIQIQNFRYSHEKLPRSLKELMAPESPVVSASPDSSEVMDRWDHPIHYLVRGKDFLVISYGADGKIGGVGLNRDLSNVTPKLKGSGIPFLQVLFHPDYRNALYVSVFSGLVAGGICFGMLKPRDLQWQGLKITLLKIAVYLAVTAFYTGVIATFEIPNGH